jgi:putative membrane protein
MKQVSTWIAAFGGRRDRGQRDRGRPPGPDRLTRLLRLVRLGLVGGLVVVVAGWMAAPGSGAPLGVQPAAAVESHAAAMGVDLAAARQEVTRLVALGPTAQTRWGPLSAADREVLIRVRLANLWEGPISAQAPEHTASQRVKDVGAVLAADHHRLDEQVLSVAKQLGVDLPDQPTSLQQGWMVELTGMRGAEYDEVFANRLRAAHGVVFGLIAEDRAATENSMVRSFAQVAVDTVMKHMSLLEGTGLFAAPKVLSLRASPIRGPFSLPVIVTVVALVLVANLALARRRSWS